MTRQSTVRRPVYRTTFARVVAVGVAAAVPLLGAVTRAEATTDAPPVGSVTLFSRSDFTGTEQNFAYNGCAPGRIFRINPAASFDNRPARGCQVQVARNGGAWFTLCAGRGVVPPVHRPTSRMRIQPGPSRLCPAG